MQEQNYPVFLPGWITKGRICGEGYGSLWELWQEDGKDSATVKYIPVPRNAQETMDLLKQGKSPEHIAAYYDSICRGADEEYAVSQELKDCRHVVRYRDMRKVRTEDGLGWNILLVMDALTPIDQCLTAPKESDVLKLGKQICLALEDSNRCGLLHGRITPRCIFRDETGNYQLGGFAGEYFSGLGDFRAPEIAEKKFSDSRADVYSLGLTLYWLLNDRCLPDQDYLAPKNGSEKLKAVVMKAINPNVGDRYQSAVELREALKAIGPKKKVSKTPGKNPLRTALAAAAALLVIGLGVAFFPKADEPVETTPPVMQEPETTAPTEATIPPPPYVLMSDAIEEEIELETAQPHSVFGSEYSRDQILSVTFLNSVQAAPEDSWDVSRDQNGTVLAWVTPLGGLYNLYIGAEGGVWAPEDCSELFAEYTMLQWFSFNNAFHTENTANMHGMFRNCKLLTALDVSALDTTGVTDMGSIFDHCESLTTLDLSGFATGNVTDMSRMFHRCKKLTEVVWPESFETGKVQNVSRMFFGCGILPDFSGFDVSSVVDYSHFLESGKKINDKPWREFFGYVPPAGAPAKTGPTLMSDTLEYKYDRKLSEYEEHSVFGSYYKRSQIRSITFQDSLKDSTMYYRWDVSKDKDGTVFAWIKPNGTLFDLYIGAEGGVVAPKSCETLFAGYSNLEEINFQNAFHTDNVTSMYQMFWGCSKLKKLNLTCFETANVKSMTYMFSGCSGLTELKVTNFDTSNVTYMGYMYYGCSSLTELNVTGFDTSNVTDMCGMYYGCSSLTELNVTGFDTSDVTRMDGMFYGCSSLTELNVTGFDTSNVTRMDRMFYGCSSLTELNVTGFDTSNVTRMDGMFYGCSSLKELDVSGFQVSKVSSKGDFMNAEGTINGEPWEEFFKKQKELSLLFPKTQEVTITTPDLSFRVILQGLENREVKWSSLDEQIATVDENGVVTALGKGVTTILFEYRYDGNNYKAGIIIRCDW